MPRLVEAVARAMLREIEAVLEVRADNIYIELYDNYESVDVAPCECKVILCVNEVHTDLRSKRIVVIGNRFPRLRSFRKVNVYHVEGNKYVLTTSGGLCLITMERGLIRDVSIPSEIIEAYNVLSEYFMEFGALRIRDAVNILCTAMSIDKVQARALLQELVKLRLIAIRNVYIELTSVVLSSG